jgi:hypothetical protein
MNQILIGHLDPAASSAKPPVKARTVAAIFTHRQCPLQAGQAHSSAPEGFRRGAHHRAQLVCLRIELGLLLPDSAHRLIRNVITARPAQPEIKCCPVVDLPARRSTLS